MIFRAKYRWFKILYLEFFFLFFRKYYFSFGHATSLYWSTRFSGHYQSLFFFNLFYFPAESPKVNKSSEKVRSFYHTVFLKKFHSFYEPQLTWHWKKYALATQPKTFLTSQFFQPTFFCLVSEKTYAPYHFLRPKNCILEALWKQMSLYFFISP